MFNQINKVGGITSGMLSGLLWGLDTVLIGLIISSSPFIDTSKAIIIAPIIGAFLHDSFSSIWLFIYLAIKGEFIKNIKLLKTRSGKYVCIAALFGGPIGMGAYLLAINYIGAGYTASISAMYPAAGALFAYIFLNEKLSLKGCIGLTISILAVVIIGYTPNQSIRANFIIGFICAIVCVLGWSLESVICAYGMKNDEINPLQALQIRQLISAISYGLIIIPIINGLSIVQAVISSKLIIFIAVVALIGTLSYTFYYMAIDDIGPVRATGLNITYSMWAIVLDIIIMGNPITPKLIFCSILIIIGTIMVSKK